MVGVKRAIIPAAGLSSRMYPYTKHINKLMLPILNKPIVHYLVDECVDAGIKEIIISGSNLKDVKDYFRKDPNLRKMVKKFGNRFGMNKLKSTEEHCKIIYVTQKRPRGWEYELYRARKKLKGEPFAVLFADCIYPEKKHSLKYLVKRFNKTGENLTSSVGRYVFRPDVLRILKKLNFQDGDPNKKSEHDFIKQVMKHKGLQFLYKVIGKYALETGKPLDYIKTQTYFALHDKSIKKEYKKYLKKIMKNEVRRY